MLASAGYAKTIPTIAKPQYTFNWRMNFFMINPLLSAERRQREVQTAAPPSQYNLFFDKSIAACVLGRWLVKVLVFVLDRLRYLMPPYYPPHLSQHRISGPHIAVSYRIYNIDTFTCKLGHFAESECPEIEPTITVYECLA